MRNASIFASLSLVAALAACASDGDSPSGTSPQGGDPSDPGGASQAPEDRPLTAKPLCATVAVGESFGKGCSGTGYGQSVCVLDDPTCGTDVCVYQSTDDKFSFTCGASCNVGAKDRCPLGFSCEAPDASCSGGVKGVCVAAKDVECITVSGAGTIFEGPKGELLRLGSVAGSATGNVSYQLAVKNGATFEELLTFDSLPSVRAAARSKDALLIVTADQEIVFADGKATASKLADTTSVSYNARYSTLADGSFVRLEPQGSTAGYAALLARGANGKWKEVGPTSRRIRSLASLGAGFVARCEDALCVSSDGREFKDLALPPGAALPAEDTSDVLRVAGASADDFYLVLAGALYHQRKGEWVTEGPKSVAGKTTNRDKLQVSSAGVAVFSTYDETKSQSLTYATLDSCWLPTPSLSTFSDGTLVKDRLYTYDSYKSQLCSRRVE